MKAPRGKRSRPPARVCPSCRAEFQPKQSWMVGQVFCSRACYRRTVDRANAVGIADHKERITSGAK